MPKSDAPLLNTDEHPVVLFQAPHLTYRQHDEPAARLLELLQRFPRETVIADATPEFIDRLNKFVRARNTYLRGLVEESRGKIAAAVSLYIESAVISEEFTSGYAQALGIATALAAKSPETAEGILRRLIEAQPDRPVARQLLDRLKTR